MPKNNWCFGKRSKSKCLFLKTMLECINHGKKTYLSATMMSPLELVTDSSSGGSVWGDHHYHHHCPHYHQHPHSSDQFLPDLSWTGRGRRRSPLSSSSFHHHHLSIINHHMQEHPLTRSWRLNHWLEGSSKSWPDIGNITSPKKSFRPNMSLRDILWWWFQW